MKNKGVKDFHPINKHNINKYKNVFNNMKILDTLQIKNCPKWKDFKIDDGLDKQRHTRSILELKVMVHLAKNIMKWFFK